jgi:tRNA A37 threonylcarbamoyladenosine dehydratase
MGMAQKLDPTKLKTADIWETQGCPLARLVRQGLRKRGFTGHFTVVYSDEQLPLRKEIGVSCGSGQCLCPARQPRAVAAAGAVPGAAGVAAMTAGDTATAGTGSGLPECGALESGAGPVEWCGSKKVINGSAVTVTAAAGFILASLVVRSVCARFGNGEIP